MGLGMGHAFLRHATRARVLLHLVDGSLQDVGGSVREVNGELAAYGAVLEEKPQVLVVNKIDLSEVAGRRAEIAAELGIVRRLCFSSQRLGGSTSSP